MSNNLLDQLGISRPADVLRRRNGSGKIAKKQTIATSLIQIVEDSEIVLWHNPNGDAYASIVVADHHENVLLKTKSFRRWLSRQYYIAYESVPGAQALQDAIGVIEGKAIYSGEEHSAPVRLADYNGSIFLDLGDPAWRAVEVSSDGWKIVNDPPVRFRRPKALLSLPEPVVGGSVDELREFANVHDDHWSLLLAWIMASYRPSGPYPVLNLSGEQGSAKSTTARLVRSLVDPNSAPLRSEPREPRDLAIAANNGWIVSLDNVSRLSPWLSDALCRLSTGGGFATRELYSDSDEAIFDAMRPVMLNGIEEVASRADLLDRGVMVSLPSIPDRQRVPEKVYWDRFQKRQPAILGALLTALSATMQRLPTIKLSTLPRMADFALWSVAAAPSIGLEPGEFMAAYSENRSAANDLALESTPVSKIIIELISNTQEWSGTATELLAEIDRIADDKTRRLKVWPQTARTLSGILKRLAPNLRAVGVEVDLGRTKQGRYVSLRTSRDFCVTTVTSVTTPQNPEEFEGAGDARVTQGDAGVTLKNPRNDAGDAGDAEFPIHSKEVEMEEIVL